MSLENILSFIKEYHKKIFYFFVIIFFVMIYLEYFSCCVRDKRVEISIVNPIVANYSSDMNFLQCLAEQHSCLYRNLRLNISQDKIMEVCKDENFCSSSIFNSK